MTWDRKLSRPIALSDGRKLRTLHCAAECLIATFDGISHWPALEHARDLLMTAAETGKRADIATATVQEFPSGTRKPAGRRAEVPLWPVRQSSSFFPEVGRNRTTRAELYLSDGDPQEVAASDALWHHLLSKISAGQ